MARSSRFTVLTNTLSHTSAVDILWHVLSEVRRFPRKNTESAVFKDHIHRLLDGGSAKSQRWDGLLLNHGGLSQGILEITLPRSHRQPWEGHL